jgi:hypothetical protein
MLSASFIPRPPAPGTRSWYDPAHVSLSVYAPGPPANLGDERLLKLLIEPPHQLTAREAAALHYFVSRGSPPISSWQQMHPEVWNERLVLIAEGSYAGYRELVMLVDDRSDIRIPKLEAGRSYSQNELNYPELHNIGYYTSAELDQLLGVNQPEFVPSKLPGLILRLHEVSYQAPENVYPAFLPQVVQALRTIAWKEQVSRAGQATTYHPSPFLSPGASPPPPPPPPGQATPRRPFSFLRRLLGKGR